MTGATGATGPTGTGGGGGATGAIFPRGLTNVGVASSYTIPDDLSSGGIVYMSAAGLQSLSWDPSTFTSGTTSFGPFIWGLRRAQAAVLRYDENTGMVDVVELNDTGPGATIPQAAGKGALFVDSSGNGWTIQTTADLLVEVQQEPPLVANTFAIPGAAKALLVYDSVHNYAILLSQGPGQWQIARFNLTTHVFSADVPVGPVSGDVAPSLFFAADPAAPNGGYVFVTYTTGVNDVILKVDPVTLATLGTFSLAGSAAPHDMEYVPITGGHAVVVIGGPNANQMYSVNAATMTQIGATLTVTGATQLQAGVYDQGGNVWVTDSSTHPATIFQVAVNATGALTGSTAFPIDTVATSETDGITFDANSTSLWVSSANIDRLYQVATTGSVQGSFDIAGNTAALLPGAAGQVLVSQGPGLPPAWNSGGGGATGATGATGPTGATGATGSAAVNSGDNWKGRRWVLNHGARRPGNAAISVFYNLGTGTLADLDIAFPGNAGASAVTPATEYVIVLDSSITGSPLLVLNHSTGALVTSLPTGGGVLANNGYDRVAYVGGSSFIQTGTVLHDFAIIVQSQVVTGPKMAVVDMTNGGSNVATLGATGPLSHLYFDGAEVFFTDANGALWVTSPYSGFAGATQIQVNGTFNTNCQYMVSDGTYLYIPQPTSNTIARVGPGYSTSGAPVTSFPIGVGAGATGITFDGRYLWVTLATSATSTTVVQVDVSTMAVVSQRQSGPVGGAVKSICWDGDSVWSCASAFNVASGNPQLFSNDPDQPYGGGFGGVEGEYQAFNLPQRVVARGTPGGSWIYVLCTGDNSIKVLKNEQFPA